MFPGCEACTSHNQPFVLLVPDFLEEAMCQRLFYGDALLRVQSQQPLEQILGVVVEVVTELTPTYILAISLKSMPLLLSSLGSLSS